MKNIFDIHSQSDFQAACIEMFNYQFQNIPVYNEFCKHLKIKPDDIDAVVEIPFLPIEMFKKHTVLDQNSSVKSFFQSSGTADMKVRSKHYIPDFTLYEESIYQSFAQFIGAPEEYIFLGLLPNYSENPHSSLIYMVDFLMKKSRQPENDYFLYNHQELLDLLLKLQDKKVILFGVSFALLDFLEFIKKKGMDSLPIFGSTGAIIETGGMKGRKEEMTKDELLKILQAGFGTDRIFSEYSMTELLSQAYSLGRNIYESPNWMRILIRSTEDPFSYVATGRTGAINIIDLANRHSCAFIATQDLGNLHDINSQKSIHKPFSVAGRIDHSDIRGCSLLVV